MLTKVSEALSKFLSPITSAAKVSARPFVPDRREKAPPRKEQSFKKEDRLTHSSSSSSPVSSFVSSFDLQMPPVSPFKGFQKLGLQIYAQASRLQKTAGRFKKGVILDEKAG